MNDAVSELGQLRRNGAIDIRNRSDTEIGSVDAEQGLDSVERAANRFQRDDRIGNRGGLGIVGDRVDLGGAHFDRGIEGADELFNPHLIPGRHPAERSGPGLQHRGQRIVLHGFLRFLTKELHGNASQRCGGRGRQRPLGQQHEIESPPREVVFSHVGVP